MLIHEVLERVHAPIDDDVETGVYVFVLGDLLGGEG